MAERTFKEMHDEQELLRSTKPVEYIKSLPGHLFWILDIELIGDNYFVTKTKIDNEFLYGDYFFQYNNDPDTLTDDESHIILELCKDIETKMSDNYSYWKSKMEIKIPLNKIKYAKVADSALLLSLTNKFKAKGYDETRLR